MKNNLITISKKLRKQSTDTEKLLWTYLRAKRLNNLKFRRQQLIGRYIVDFVCFEKKIIIELDGSQHFEKHQQHKDIVRDNWFKSQGFRVLRFWDNEVFQNTEQVLEIILWNCLNHPPLNPLPSREGK